MLGFRLAPARMMKGFPVVHDDFSAVRGAPLTGAAAFSRRARKQRFGLIAILMAVGLAMAPSASFAQGGPQDFSYLSARLLPTVVNVSARAKAPDSRQEGPDLSQIPPGSPFEQFFKDFMERNGQGEQAPRRGLSVGSGFIIDAGKGY